MDFTNPDVFSSSSLERSKKGSYDVITFPAGSTIYRSDRGGAKDPSENVPIFFSDRESISSYGGSEEANVSSYSTTKPVTLFVLSFANIVEIIKDETISESVKAFIADLYLKSGQVTEDQWNTLKSQGFPAKEGVSVPKSLPFIIPAQPLAKSGQYLVYTNRLFADIICKIGFDGWIAFPKSLVQRNLDSAYYSQHREQFPIDAAAGNVRYVYNMYAPEIVLCNWKAMATRVTGGKRWKMPRKMSRKYCKKTPCKKMGFTQRSSCRPYKNCFTRRARRKA